MGVSPCQPKIAEALRLLQASSCFRGEVCGSLPCACAETLAAMAATPPTSVQTVTAEDLEHVRSALATLSDPLTIVVAGHLTGTARALAIVHAMRDIAATAALRLPTLTSSPTAAEARNAELEQALSCISTPVDVAKPFAWVIPGSDTANDRGFIDAMAWEEGEFTKPLYAAPVDVAKLKARLGELEKALKPFAKTGWMTGEIEHTARAVVAHMHPGQEYETVLSSDDFKRARDLLAALSQTEERV